jgi:hypothetical protein
MANPADQQFTSGEKGVMGIGAVIGYLVGWYLRVQAGQTGALAGAIYGGLGTAGGFLVASLLVLLLRGMKTRR